MTRIAIIGAGPAGYEAAQVAAGLGAEVTIVESDGIGGACVLYDCVPSKTLIATSEKVTAVREAPALGVCHTAADVGVRLGLVNQRVRELAANQSGDIRERLIRAGVTLLRGRARFAEDQPGRTFVIEVAGAGERLAADVVLLATGGTPRVLPGAEPDGERILSWRQIYDLTELPEHLIVVGSGVTGAEFASAYSEMGVPVTLVSSRQKVLPGEDPDAADVIEQVFTAHGGTLMKQARAGSVERVGDGVRVRL
ncbi:MAG TPA: FAD-dependent oxidoreductase, partial [Jatrophihabitans sp.]|nr:FAD-dependent oxidoreductase [Jatrophihabitans sp.]